MKERLWELVKKIPNGKVTTYSIIAEKLDTSPRAVGAMLKTNPELVAIPCHRVVMSDGSLGGYVNGSDNKRRLLKEEGVDFSGKIDLSECLFSF